MRILTQFKKIIILVQILIPNNKMWSYVIKNSPNKHKKTNPTCVAPLLFYCSSHVDSQDALFITAKVKITGDI